ncbi:MAG: phosphonate ABC transporter, permease protein PhnE [Eubacteriales bacterium]
MRGDIFFIKRRNNIIIFIIITSITISSMMITDYDVVKGFTCIIKAIQWTVSNFYPDMKSLEKLPDILTKLKETVLMSITATTVASILAFLFALFGSNTTKVNSFLSIISRGIASINRNIPLVAWAMILLLSFGQSALTGLLALFFATFGFLTRAFMETIDEVSSSSVEALRATGANYLQIIFQAVLPSTLPQLISWILYMIDTNIRDATLVGILTGTGIGFIFNLYYRTMNYHTASLVVIFIVLTVFITELISNYIRRVIL